MPATQSVLPSLFLPSFWSSFCWPSGHSNRLWSRIILTGGFSTAPRLPSPSVPNGSPEAETQLILGCECQVLTVAMQLETCHLLAGLIFFKI